MGEQAALEAVARPAALYGRPFDSGAAEELVRKLRQFGGSNQEDTVSGQYVEPVQLQVVCIKLWEKIEKIKDRPPGPIKLDELVEVGDALEEYYEEVLAAVLADKGSGVAEDQVRAWFDEKLITKAGTRGFVLQTKADTGELSNSAVKLLEEKFLICRERVPAAFGMSWCTTRLSARYGDPTRGGDCGRASRRSSVSRCIPRSFRPELKSPFRGRSKTPRSCRSSRST